MGFLEAGGLALQGKIRRRAASALGATRLPYIGKVLLIPVSWPLPDPDINPS